MAPSNEKVFANDLEEYILELSKKAIYNILDQEAFDIWSKIVDNDKIILGNKKKLIK